MDNAARYLNSILHHRWVRFLVGGSLNTGVTYICFLILSYFLNYQIAFLIAYISGICFSYFFNAKIVFRAPLSWKAFMAYPIVYVIQYIFSAVTLGLFIEKLGFSKITAPIIVAIVTIPLTYLLSRIIIHKFSSKG